MRRGRARRESVRLAVDEELRERERERERDERGEREKIKESVRFNGKRLNKPWKNKRLAVDKKAHEREEKKKNRGMGKKKKRNMYWREKGIKGWKLGEGYGKRKSDVADIGGAKKLSLSFSF